MKRRDKVTSQSKLQTQQFFTSWSASSSSFKDSLARIEKAWVCQRKNINLVVAWTAHAISAIPEAAADTKHSHRSSK